MFFQITQRSSTFTHLNFFFFFGNMNTLTQSSIQTTAGSPKSGARSSHSRSSGAASKPVMGGVRRERNQIIHLLSLAGRPMKLSGAESTL